MATIKEMLAAKMAKRGQIDEILPYIFLGNGYSASKLEELKAKGITHIMNVADDVKNFHPGKFTYINLSVADFGADKGISRVFPQAIAEAKKLEEGKKGKVYVHCAAGMNRSPTVVLALLMALHGSAGDCMDHRSSSPFCV